VSNANDEERSESREPREPRAFYTDFLTATSDLNNTTNPY